MVQKNRMFAFLFLDSSQNHNTNLTASHCDIMFSLCSYLTAANLTAPSNFSKVNKKVVFESSIILAVIHRRSISFSNNKVSDSEQLLTKIFKKNLDL